MAKMVPHFANKFDYSQTLSLADRYKKGWMAEWDVYETLRDAPETRDWTALHGIWLSDTSRRDEQEVDFVIIAPAIGIIALEVKSWTQRPPSYELKNALHQAR